MQLGNNINRQDANGNTLLLKAIMNTRQALAGGFWDETNPFHYLIKTLLNYKPTNPEDPNQVIDFTITNNDGQSALSLAQDEGTPATIRSLIKNKVWGASSNE